MVLFQKYIPKLFSWVTANHQDVGGNGIYKVHTSVDGAFPVTAQVQ
jgi:hypothetical protein